MARSLLAPGFMVHFKDGVSNPVEFDGVKVMRMATRLLREAVKAVGVRRVDP
jgi:hypothetical protein